MGQLPLDLNGWIDPERLCALVNAIYPRLEVIRSGILRDALDELHYLVTTYQRDGKASIRPEPDWKRGMALYALGYRLAECASALFDAGEDPSDLLKHAAKAKNDGDALHDESQLHCWAQLVAGAKEGRLEGKVSAIPADRKGTLPDLQLDEIGLEVKTRSSAAPLQDRDAAARLIQEGVIHAAEKAHDGSRIVAFVDCGPLDLFSQGQSRSAFRGNKEWFGERIREIFEIPDARDVPALVLTTWRVGLEQDQAGLQFSKSLYINEGAKRPLPNMHRRLLRSVFAPPAPEKSSLRRSGYLRSSAPF